MKPRTARLGAAVALSLWVAGATLAAPAQPAPPGVPRRPPWLRDRAGAHPAGSGSDGRPGRAHTDREDAGPNSSTSKPNPLSSDLPLRPRAERRHAKREALKQRWGDAALSKPAVRSELRVHAWRLARLARLERLARDAGKDAAVARIQRLRDRENTRHQRKMDALAQRGAAP